MEDFKQDVDKGLSSDPKTLPSKYFYDEKGDALFVKIMHMPEYYLTRAEMEIFKTKSGDIISELGLKKDSYFELIEMGAGDGTKTKELLAELDKQGYQFDYLPIDISPFALDGLEKMLAKDLPNVSVKIQAGDYFNILESLKDSPNPKVVLFLGSNIGNMKDSIASRFLYDLGANLKKGDKLLLGVDLIKSEEIVLPAYNDNKGITREFNLNLLRRINRELGADFSVDDFCHAPEYTEEEGIAKSFLQSKKAQVVTIRSLGKSYSFEEGERIHTEISRKYSDDVLQKIIAPTDFVISGCLTDSKSYFADYILTRE